MKVFKVIKQSVTTRQVAEYYGVRPLKNVLALCPSHGDRRLSLKSNILSTLDSNRL